MADDIISTEAFNATAQDDKWIRENSYAHVFGSKEYDRFVKGDVSDNFINIMADKLYQNGEIGDSLVFVLEYTLSLKSTGPTVKQNIIKVANAIRQRYLELMTEAWKYRNKDNEKYSIYLSSKNETPNILGDVRNFHNFRDTKLFLKEKVGDKKIENTKAKNIQSFPSPKNYLMSKDDFYFAKPLPGLKQKEGIQPIIINEFQPEVMFYAEAWASHLTVDIAKITGIDKVVEAFKNVFNKSTILAEKYVKAEQSNSALKMYSAKPDLLYNKEAYENGTNGLNMHPIQMLKQMFNTR